MVVRSLISIFVVLGLSSFAVAKSISFRDQVSQSSVSKLLERVKAASQESNEQIEVSFESNGGDLVAAVRGFEELQKYRVNTFVAKNCGSACTVLFAAGTQRRAHSRAEFFFHQVGVHVKEGDDSSENVSAYRQKYAQIWADVVRTVAPGLAAELERDQILIKGERTYTKSTLLKYGYLNVK